VLGVGEEMSRAADGRMREIGRVYSKVDVLQRMPGVREISRFLELRICVVVVVVGDSDRRRLCQMENSEESE